jgi:hypothetical protein
MRRIAAVVATGVLSLLAVPLANAATVIATGTYQAGVDSGLDAGINTGSQIYLSPGKYRFTLQASSPLVDFEGDAVVNELDIFTCELDDGPFICGADDEDLLNAFERSGPKTFTADITVIPPTVLGTPSSNEASSDDYEYVRAYDLLSNSDGSYVLSVSPVPESRTWALMIAGFAVVGFGMRDARRRRAQSALAALPAWPAVPRVAVRVIRERDRSRKEQQCAF